MFANTFLPQKNKLVRAEAQAQPDLNSIFTQLGHWSSPVNKLTTICMRE